MGGLRCLTDDDSQMDGQAKPVLHFGGNVERFDQLAQLELSFGYLSGFRDGC